ncbi:Uncharacterised protein [Mycobacterium tuberculosis]|nr:Uncharacterised protein [Mycobacterium tuberculosis]
MLVINSNQYQQNLKMQRFCQIHSIFQKQTMIKFL